MKWLYWKIIGAIDIVWHTLRGRDGVWICRKCEEYLDKHIDDMVEKTYGEGSARS